MERLSLRKRVLALGAPLLFTLLTACGEDSGSTPSPQTEKNTPEPQVTAEYYSNGNRILRYEHESGRYADVLQTCDGLDLTEQSEYLAYGSAAAGNSFSRSVNHPACKDGRLTEEDFKITK